MGSTMVSPKMDPPSIGDLRSSTSPQEPRPFVKGLLLCHPPMLVSSTTFHLAVV